MSEFHISGDHFDSDMAPFSEYAPDVLDALDGAFDDAETVTDSYLTLPNICVTAGEGVVIGMCLNESEGSTLHDHDTSDREVFGDGLVMGEHEGAWYQGTHLYSAHHEGLRADFIDIRRDRSLLLVNETINTGETVVGAHAFRAGH